MSMDIGQPSSSKNDSASLNYSIPALASLSLEFEQENWEVFGYPHYLEFFGQQNHSQQLQHELAKLVAVAKKYQAQAHYQGHRRDIIVGGNHFLAGVFSQKKMIRLASPNANLELATLKCLRHETDLGTQEFKQHVDELVSLDLATFPTEIQEITLTAQLPDLHEDRFLAINEESHRLAKVLLHRVQQYRPSFFERVSDFALKLTIDYEVLRLHLLKFIAVLPSLEHDKKGTEVKRMALEAARRILEDDEALKKREQTTSKGLDHYLVILVAMARMICMVIPARLFAWVIRSKVRFMAKRFIAGESLEKGLSTLDQLRRTGRDATLDQLGELVVSEAEADYYLNQVLKLIKGSSLHTHKDDCNKAGINRAHISIKVSALSSDFNPDSFEGTYNSVAPRLIRILTEAAKEGVFINIDAEHYHYRDLVFEIYAKVLQETPELADYQATGIVVQAYLRDAAEHLKQVLQLAQKRKMNMPIRLVKGAYWDAETIEARVHGHNAPQFLNKEESDLNFRKLTIAILENHEHLQLCLGSHNYSDHCFAEALRTKLYPQAPIIEHQCLHMTYEALSVGMSKLGWCVRNYVPIGSLLMGMAYLVRRILENSSQVGVLTQMHSHKKGVKIEDPSLVHQGKIKHNELVRDASQCYLSSKFRPVTPVRTYLHQERRSFDQAVEKLSSQLGKLFAEGSGFTGDTIEVTSPSDPEQVVGKIQLASSADTKKVIDKITKSTNGQEWAKAPAGLRGSIMLHAGELMRLERDQLSALISLEAGKPPKEALADVDEAIDFINYYARQMLHLYKRHQLKPLGPVAVIAPWNFPLAIACGMSVAPLAAGCPVILKPAEQSPLITQKMVELFHKAGVPNDVLIHLPGKGRIVGTEMVQDERMAGVVFTGSKLVGTFISSQVGMRLAKNLEGKTIIPRVITEMGGKNGIIITGNADLDETLTGVLYSAFGHAGQKCSACSRVFVHESIKDSFIQRFVLACKDLKVGISTDHAAFMGPVINIKERDRLRKEVQEAARECATHGGRVLINRSKENLPGACLGPVVFELPPERCLDPDSFAQKELFGPVVHVTSFQTLDEALALFNSSAYALTGGIFSQSQDEIDYLVDRLECGNVYVNRGCTGARVGIEPFGGFKLSGTGPKAGGRDYLWPFLHKIDILPAPPTPNVSSEVIEHAEHVPALTGPSTLPLADRVIKVGKGISQLLQNFESIFGGVDEVQKDLIKEVRWFLRNDLLQHLKKRDPNVYTPGQTNLRDLSLTKGSGVLVTALSRPNGHTISYFIYAMALGLGQTILCRNTASYETWKKILRCFTAKGLNTEGPSLYLVNEQTLARALNQHEHEFVIADGDIEQVDQVRKLIFKEGRQSAKYVANILCEADGPSLDLYPQLLAKFINERSLAINTMRYGAPLELNV